MIQVWIAIIATIVAPTVLFFLHKHDEGKIIKDTQLKSIRLELLFMIEHHPDDTHTILTLWDEYRQKGGNSYVTRYVHKWQQNRAKK